MTQHGRSAAAGMGDAPQGPADASREDGIRQAYAELGRLGGKKGGERTKARYGPDFYSAIGKKGGAARRAQLAGGVLRTRPDEG